MARELQPCGTTAAYARHLRHAEQPCPACKAARAAASAAYRADVRRITQARIVWAGIHRRRAARHRGDQ